MYPFFGDTGVVVVVLCFVVVLTNVLGVHWRCGGFLGGGVIGRGGLVASILSVLWAVVGFC